MSEGIPLGRRWKEAGASRFEKGQEMNKWILPVIVATLAAVASETARFFSFGGGSYRSGTPHIPNRGGRHRIRVHAPADGRWHMKYHRGRAT